MKIFVLVQMKNKNQMLDAWKKGQTGYPLVDACIRSLRHTGWLNFRMRAMIVSLLVTIYGSTGCD